MGIFHFFSQKQSNSRADFEAPSFSWKPQPFFLRLLRLLFLGTIRFSVRIHPEKFEERFIAEKSSERGPVDDAQNSK